MIYWNADGLGRKQSELQSLLNELRIDVVALCETRLTSRIALNISGYTCYRQDKHRNGKGQGVALLVKTDLPHLLLSTPPTKNLEAIGVKLTTVDSAIEIYSVYQSPSPKIPLLTSDLDILLKTGIKVLIMGDINARHELWSRGSNNTRGNLLFNHMMARDYTIYAPSSPSLVHYRHDLQPSTPDLVLANNMYNIEDIKCIPALSSNHLPVYLQIKSAFKRKVVKRFNYTKANWAGYRSYLNNHISLTTQTFRNTNEINIIIDNLTTNILSARDAHVPLVTIKENINSLPRKVKRLITFKNRLRRHYQLEANSQIRKNLRTQINFLDKNIDKAIRDHNDRMWKNKLLKVVNPGSDLWRLVKSVKATHNSVNIPPLKRRDGTVTTDPREKCEELASAFHENMCLTGNWVNEDADTKVRSAMSVFESHSAAGHFCPVKPSEVWRYTRKLKTRKAPGADNVATCLVKSLPQKALVLLTKIFNGCLALAFYPPAWKSAKVIAIKKPGKDGSIPVSYRPISLLSTLGKLFEKIINARLLRATAPIIIDEQFGFRNAHSTVHQLARLAENVVQGLNQDESTGMFLLDIEKAFDTVWHEGLLYKLMKCNVPRSLVKIIQSYLCERNFKVYLDNDVTSSNRCVPAGVPQGSILGPYLFLLYINDIPTQVRTSLACFADDTACFTTSNDTDLIIGRLQLAIELLCEYFAKWKLKLNAAKTEAIIFTRKRQLPTKTLTIDGHIIPWSKSVKYLGLVLDKELNWSQHVSIIRTKAMKAFNALSPLLNRRSALSPGTKLALYTTLIRPCITYGCPVWSSTSNSNHNQLQIIQNRAIKIAFNTPFRTNLNKIHERIHFPLIFDFIIKLTKTFYKNLNENHHNQLVLTIGRTKPKSNKPGKSRYRYLIRLPHHYALDSNDFAQPQPVPIRNRPGGRPAGTARRARAAHCRPPDV